MLVIRIYIAPYAFFEPFLATSIVPHKEVSLSAKIHYEAKMKYAWTTWENELVKNLWIAQNFVAGWLSKNFEKQELVCLIARTYIDYGDSDSRHCSRSKGGKYSIENYWKELLVKGKDLPK